jgi:two-component system, NtrC family, sensor kinase
MAPDAVLHLANPEFAALLDSVECGVLLFNNAGELRAINDRLAEMLRMEPAVLRDSKNFETVVARVVPNFASPEALAARWHRRFHSDEASWDELEVVRPERKVIERFARPVLDSRRRRLGWLEIYRDVTAQRLVEKKMFHADRMAALGQLVSSIAHELNNPLTSILGYAQLLRRRTGADGQDREAKYILEQAERASRIAKNLLLFAREAKPDRMPVNLNEVAERTLALRSYELRLVNIVVECDLDPVLPLVLADAAQMQQVLLNLVFNAEQALEHRGGLGHIRLRTRKKSAERVAIEVADDGPGIAPEVLPRIFDPFFTTKPPGIGTGLGLSIVYGIVQDHGGEVLVESKEGDGATFKVELPIVMAPMLGVTVANEASALQMPGGSHPDASQTGQSAQTIETSLPDGIRSAHLSMSPEKQGSRKILVVEDEPTVAQLIADVLGHDGHSVDVLLDSRMGLDRMAQIGYDLVICDLRMPHLDGSSFYRELQRQNSPMAQRLVFVTGDSLSPNTAAFLEKSGVRCLTKPFPVEQLKTMVYAALAAASQQRPEDVHRRFGGSRRAAKKRRSGKKF